MAWLYLQENEQVQYLQKIAMQKIRLDHIIYVSGWIFCTKCNFLLPLRQHIFRQQRQGIEPAVSCHFHLLVYLFVNIFIFFDIKPMTELLETLKQQVIDALNLEDLTPEDIDVDAPLFGEGLGLDSIDALELIMILEKEYGIKLQSPAQGKEIFKSIRTMAEFIQEHRTK